MYACAIEVYCVAVLTDYNVALFTGITMLNVSATAKTMVWNRKHEVPKYN